MTSAFYPTSPIKLTNQEFSEGLPHFANCGQETDVGETEDEEVKINCLHGADRDSDLSFADSDEDSEDGEDDESVADPCESAGVVHFVSGRVQVVAAGIEIYRPRPERFFCGNMRLASHKEENDFDLDSNSSVSRESVGARGIGISIGTPTSKMSTDGSPSDGDESSISDDDDDDDSVNEECDVDECVREEEQPDQIALVTDESYPSDGDDDYTDHDLSNLPDLIEAEMSDEYESHPTQEKVPRLQDEETEASDGIIFLIPKHDSVYDSAGATTIKRSHSSCSFEALFVDDRFNSPKRQRSSDLPFMPSLFLGPAALASSSSHMRLNGSPISSSDDDEGDLDKRLSEELDSEGRSPSRENTPVPLLTPPASPLTIELGGGTTATVCEWPSNLAVDSALTAVSNLRPMSPESLEQLELDEEQRVGTEASTLTPLLRGIYVGIQ